MTINDRPTPQIEERQTKILGWPTDTLCIDYYASKHEESSTGPRTPSRKEAPHTVLILFPGNPGQYDWYVQDLLELVKRLGRGYAARAVSHAGHSLSGNAGIVNVEEYARLNTNENADVSTPWTIRGQVLHKAAYMQQVIAELDEVQLQWDTQTKDEEAEQSTYGRPCDLKSKSTSTTRLSSTTPRFIFMGHSFGCHVVQQLCILKPELLERTLGFLHLMPFIRMKADYFNQMKLNLGASSPSVLITLGTLLSRTYQALPKSWVDAFVKLNIHDDKTRDIAVRLLRQPAFVRNFFTLGTEEIRDIPKDTDISTLGFLGKRRPIFMLFVGNDQWAPFFHMTEIARLQAKNILPPNIFMTYLPELRHDYVSHDGMSSTVVGWCLQCITSIAMEGSAMNTKLVNQGFSSNRSQKGRLRSKL
mmetsp:Transcript_32887/g.55117  ORF Transcript_32887/g.55117 Transcript_32887/m.55117 type:complete len:418 (-) Transcript_32887:1029-2282(-)|eukprot:CAMPEP_0178817252 /NCGR_PEP_ID=MMETSP0746-20121128/1787_1 /TAXON_ID=913974 /ORGANISM="Nitzschia punctata, Strain CCMP561" /LENGTH=417 /DNA_ID=CAMNT_0020478333 /DNA_START=349 /DNA_END=1602 /DNA_ORIENTATION=+